MTLPIEPEEKAGAVRTAIDIVREMVERGYAFDEDHQILAKELTSLRASLDAARARVEGLEDVATKAKRAYDCWLNGGRSDPLTFTETMDKLGAALRGGDATP